MKKILSYISALILSSEVLSACISDNHIELIPLDKQLLEGTWIPQDYGTDPNVFAFEFYGDSVAVFQQKDTITETMFATKYRLAINRVNFDNVGKFNEFVATIYDQTRNDMRMIVSFVIDPKIGKKDTEFKVSRLGLIYGSDE